MPESSWKVGDIVKVESFLNVTSGIIERFEGQSVILKDCFDLFGPLPAKCRASLHTLTPLNEPNPRRMGLLDLMGDKE